MSLWSNSMKLGHSQQPSCRARWLGLLTLAALTWFWVGLVNAMPVVGSPPPMVDVGPGHSAYWFNAQRDGEGIVLEILEDSRAQMYWFTYDEQGQQRWLLGTGDIETSEDGTRAVFPVLHVTRGGQFGSAFDPDDVELEAVGSATMAFLGCEQATFTYQAFEQDETINMTRLSRTMGLDCAAPIHGRTMFPVTEDARLSGTWFDPERNGEGFSLQWLDRDSAQLTWYTYDDEGNQRWIIGEGRREGDEIEFDSLLTTRGGRFGPDFDPEAVELLPWGTLSMNLDCDEGSMTYDSPLSGFGEGGMNLARLTHLTKLPCDRQTPELLDLYDVELVAEIPVGTPGFPIANRVSSMTDDGGIVFGMYPSNGRYRLWRWQGAGNGLDQLPGLARYDGSVMTPDGETIYAVLYEVPEGVSGDQNSLYFWTEVDGWKLLPDAFLPRTIIHGISQNGEYLVGRGKDNLEDIFSLLWVWSGSTGQIVVATEENSDVIFGIRGVSNDGRTIVGFGTDFGGPGSSRRDRAARWVDGQPDFLQDDSGNSLLVAFGCAANCEVIYGGGQSVDSDLAQPTYRQAWFWTESFGTEYVGRLPEAEQVSYDAVLAISADGNLLVGDAPIRRPGNRIGTRGFIWTRATGLQPLSDILQELGISDSSWENTGVVDVSPDGLLWLVSMRRNNGSNSAEGNTWAGLIRLTPRVQLFD